MWRKQWKHFLLSSLKSTWRIPVASFQKTHHHLQSGNDSTYELEEGDWLPDDWTDSADPIEDVMDDGICLEEENWRAHYGQVERPVENSVSHIQAVDLWDWSMVKKIRKGRKRRVARLVG